MCGRTSRALARALTLAALALFVFALTLATGSAVARAAQSHGDVTQGVWAVDPGAPGPDLPPVGRSLFDHLFAHGGGYRIPFPFPALIEAVAAHVGRDALGQPGVKHVLIPLGRSLQRAAAGAAFFEYPRVLIAVDGEVPARGRGAGMLLKDRLYIGYQESAGVLEVISYNEAAARFEFQLVKDYRPGARPRVLYANRTVCIACHQNQAPIFSRQQWDETNANPRVQQRLAAHGGRLYGVAVRRGVDEPYAVDNATDRANRFAAYQLLWQRGCGPDDGAGAACRAAAFTLALQYRLADSAQFDRASDAYRLAYLARLTQYWKALWPAGLLLPDPDIPNRNPLADAQAQGTAHVAAPFDPLAPRPPLETWRHSSPADLDRLVRGLSEFFSERDVRDIDRHLETHSGRASVRQVHASCEFRRKAMGSGRVRLSVRCGQDQPLSLRGRLYAHAGGVERGSIEGLTLSGAGPLAALQVLGGRVAAQASRGEADLRLGRRGLAARTHRGEAITRLRMSWSGERGEVRAELRDDFRRVTAAVAELEGRTVAGRSDVFSAKPFRRAPSMAAVFEALGLAARGWCCADNASLPPPRSEAATTTVASRGAPAARLDRFYAYCAVCHRTRELTPPNFLEGATLEEVEAKIAHCAPRIHARLSMWRVPEAQRTKTPMPPVLALRSHGLSGGDWQRSSDLTVLLQEVEALLETDPWRPTGLHEDPAGGYESLRPCLAQSTVSAGD